MTTSVGPKAVRIHGKGLFFLFIDKVKYYLDRLFYDFVSWVAHRKVAQLRSTGFGNSLFPFGAKGVTALLYFLGGSFESSVGDTV